MNGALMKAASRFTIAAAFGLVLGVSSAQAADLGGNCCADLEERIADLEATTARKGNRKMSLTITGQVHRMILFWDDGRSSDAYYGIDNTNSSSRFSFTGTAKVTPTVSVGFDITIEIEAGGTSSKLSQFDEDGKLGDPDQRWVRCLLQRQPTSMPTLATRGVLPGGSKTRDSVV